MKTIMLNGHKEYSLPKAVYFQCLWTVKDMDRLENIREGAAALENSGEDEVFVFLDERDSFLSEFVVKEACRRLDCINSAIEEVPQEYRLGILNNIKNMEDPGDEAHSNTWKHWKQRFIYSLANKLGLY